MICFADRVSPFVSRIPQGIVIAGLLSLSLAIAGCGRNRSPEPARAESSESGGSVSRGTPESSERIRAAVRRLDEADAFPPTTPAELAERSGGDPLEIVRYIREHLETEPYSGALRGGRGVLLTGGGNDIDRMLLVRDAVLAARPGATVRYARAPLGAEGPPSFRAPAPIRALTAAEIATLTGYELTVVEAALQEEGPVAEIRALEKRIEEEVAFLERQLSEKISPAPPHESRERWWLQMELDGKWLDLDPDRESGEILPIATSTLEEFPEPLHHRLGLKLVLERLQGGQIEQEVLYQDSWNTIELAGETIALSVVPEGFRIEDLEASLAGAERFQAAVSVAGSVEMSRVFDLQGATYISEGSDFVKESGGGAAALGRGVFGMLAGGPDREESSGPDLAGLRLEIEIVGPEERPIVYQRRILDRLDRTVASEDEQRIAPQWTSLEPVRRALVRSYRMLPIPGPVDQAWLARDTKEFILDPTLAEAERALVEEGRAISPAEIRSAELFPAMRLVHVARLGQALGNPGSGEGLVHDRTGVILIRESLGAQAAEPEFRSVIDIVAGGASAAATTAALRYGVALSYAETDAAGPTSGKSAVSDLVTARRSGAVFHLVRSREEAMALRFPAAARQRLVELVEAEFLALVPELPPGSSDPVWWTVGPDGIPIATAASGEGQAMIEGTSLLRDVSIPQVERTLKFVACLNLSVASGASLSQAGGQCLCDYLGSQMPSAHAFARARAMDHIDEVYGLAPQVSFLLSEGLNYAQTYSGIPDVPWSRGCDAFGVGS